MSAHYADPLARYGVLTMVERKVIAGRAFLSGIVLSDGEYRALHMIESVDQTEREWVHDALHASANLFFPRLKNVMFNPDSVRPHL